jgi:hypothetical protein
LNIVCELFFFFLSLIFKNNNINAHAVFFYIFKQTVYWQRKHDFSKVDFLNGLSVLEELDMVLKKFFFAYKSLPNNATVTIDRFSSDYRFTGNSLKIVLR